MTTSNPESNSKSRLERLQELANKATPGPWRTRWDGQCFEVRAVDDLIAEWTFAIMPGDSDQMNECTTEDAEYIAAANPSTILDLIATVKALVSVEPFSENDLCPFCGESTWQYRSEWHKCAEPSCTQNHQAHLQVKPIHAPDCIYKIAHDKWLGTTEGAEE